MKVYVVVREFQNSTTQNEFIHISLRKAKNFIRNDEYGVGELYIETWDKGKLVGECSYCHNKVFVEEQEMLMMEPVCKPCYRKYKKWD